MHRSIGALAVLVLLLAGCADESAPGEDDLGFEEVDVTETRGAISGVVTDETIRPVANATIRIENDELETTSDETGRFKFEDLGPGIYRLDTTAEGFLAAAYSVEVKVGELSKTRLQLVTDPTPDPYMDTIPLRGYADFSIGLASYWADYVIDAAGMEDSLGTCQCFFRYDIDGNLAATVMEITWTENIANPAYESEYYWEVYADGNAFYVDGGYGTNPINVVIPADKYEDVTDFKLWVYPDDAWPAVQQDFEIFVSNFYYEAPPEGWSFVEGDE